MSLKRNSMRHAAVASLALAAVFGARPASAGFVINPTYVGMSAAAESDVNDLISFYESTFTDNITVNIEFDNMGGGLGQSNTQFGATDYGTVHGQLVADATSADDTTALAQLAANPVNNATTVFLSEANLKALGFDTSNFSGPDSVIGLNTGICFTSHNSPVAGQYDLYAVAAHELDEALGTVSGVGGNTMSISDLYRFNGSGVRSFTSDTSQHAYFSINGSTLLDEYNQFNHKPGDWGDWVVHNPGQVQDYAGSTGHTINPDVELRLLDVVGYDRVAVPEPASMGALGLGVLALIRRKRAR